jgi:hypothetical protein
MSQLTSQSLCVLGMIVAVAIIPKYITLPEGLELLFQDKIGQLLLLGLAIAVGSYNFICGLFLAMLFLSIMLKRNRQIAQEGFSDYVEDENHDMELEDFKDEPSESSPSTKSLKPKKTTKTTTTKSSTKKTSSQPDVLESEETNVSSMNYDDNQMVLPTPDVNQLKMQLDSSQEIIKDLEKKLDSYQSKETKSTNSTKSIKSMKSMESTNSEEDPTIEPFSCGCDSDDARVKLIKYQK